MSRYRMFAAGAAVALLAAVVVTPAYARPDHSGHGSSGDHRPEHSKGGGKDKVRPAATKMSFKLDEHHFDSGSTVTATAQLLSRSGKSWVPLADALLHVLVDGAEVGASVTDATGNILIEWGGALDGGHVMKVVYEGDALHRKAQRSQGFHVGTLEEPEELEEVLTPVVPTIPLEPVS